jgi:uncharacterized protein (TIGR02588 family)
MNKVQKNWLEWIVFALGLVLVTGVLGYLIYDGATLGNAPPNIEVRLGTPEQRTQGFIVPVSVKNLGDETAEGVQIEVTLESGREGTEPERGEFNIAFLPRRATHEGWVAFQTDPRCAQMKARVLGYGQP